MFVPAIPRVALVVIALGLCASPLLHAAGGQAEATDRSLYETACAACHGTDGRGVPAYQLGFDIPVPDFSDCSFSTVEPDADWMAVSHDGGPARGFDRRMPAFGEALSVSELQRVLDYLRGFCTDPAWPRGELNLPRPLVTEKAFPENEAVLTTTIGTGKNGHIGNELLYEQRLGPRSQFEVLVPIVLQEDGGGSWRRGIGDAAVAVKHAAYHDFERGRILSVAAEFVLPTGKEGAGLGSGTTVFEPFVAFGQILAGDAFVQAQAGFELPFNIERASRETFWRAALGRTYTEGQFGRSWSPMLELLGSRELEKGAATQWDIVPQMQVTLNRRQHIMLNVGVRVPLTSRSSRNSQVITYLLWDWFDGGFLEGW